MPLITRGGKGAKLTIEEMDGNLEYLESLSQGGLSGTDYLIVTANGSPSENGTALQAAYDEAKTWSLSVSRRAQIVCAPGKYEFPIGSPFTMDTEFIDLVSLTGGMDVIIYVYTDPLNPEPINADLTNFLVTTDDVLVRGVDASRKRAVTGKGLVFDIPGKFRISTGLDRLRVERCKGGAESFGRGVTASGTFVDCVGGVYSFGASFMTSLDGVASGTFIDCVGGDASFGGGIASGTFTRCTGGYQSFGFWEASGIFTDCVGGNNSFGGAPGGVGLTGKLYYCRLTEGSFQPVSSGGKVLFGIDGSNQPINQL
jgi:hypothetical protein